MERGLLLLLYERAPLLSTTLLLAALCPFARRKLSALPTPIDIQGTVENDRTERKKLLHEYASSLQRPVRHVQSTARYLSKITGNRNIIIRSVRSIKIKIKARII